MKETKILMGMPVTVEIVDSFAKSEDLENVFDHFHYVDKKFSTYKDTSEMSRINRGELNEIDYSGDMKEVLKLSEETKKITHGYFDIVFGGRRDPSGMVKGWAIQKAAELLRRRGFRNFYLEAGGDIQVSGHNIRGQNWRIGIRNPFNTREIIKVLAICGEGVATSGIYERGRHIYNPRNYAEEITDIVSLTVVGPNIYEADRFATAAFAMGKAGIYFIENLDGLEGYLVDSAGQAFMTSNFSRYLNDRIYADVDR